MSDKKSGDGPDKDRGLREASSEMSDRSGPAGKSVARGARRPSARRKASARGAADAAKRPQTSAAPEAPTAPEVTATQPDTVARTPESDAGASSGPASEPASGRRPRRRKVAARRGRASVGAQGPIEGGEKASADPGSAALSGTRAEQVVRAAGDLASTATPARAGDLGTSVDLGAESDAEAGWAEGAEAAVPPALAEALQAAHADPDSAAGGARVPVPAAVPAGTGTFAAGVSPVGVSRELGSHALPGDRPRSVEGGGAAVRRDTGRSVGTESYFRAWGRQGLLNRSEDVDDFGMDPHFDMRARRWLDPLVQRYFRLDVDGVQHVPRSGRAMLVANRGGPLPWDGLVLKTGLRLQRPELADLRWLVEDSVFHTPFLGVFMNRLGAVRACPENAARLFRQERLLAVFPEGARGASKLYRHRNDLQRFGRGGYIRVALRTGTPVVPTAVVGGAQTNPVLLRSRILGLVAGASYLPVTPTFPLLGPAGLLPAPARWRVMFGEPMDLSSYGADAASDTRLVNRINREVRARVQSMLDQSEGKRPSSVRVPDDIGEADAAFI